MTPRSAKRKRSSDIKDWLVDGLHKLTITSFTFNNDIQTLDEDFMLILKSIEDRHSELYAWLTGLEEKYGYKFYVLLIYIFHLSTTC